MARLALWWTPSFVKARVCREVSRDFTVLLAEVIAEEGGDFATFRRAARETGRRAAARLKKDLCLGDSHEDAELAWRIVTKLSGMKFTVDRGDGRSIFYHLKCPLYEAGGRRLCENFCLPMVEGLTEDISPSCGVEVLEPAEGARCCVKALTYGGSDVS